MHHGILATGRIDLAVFQQDRTLEVDDYKTSLRQFDSDELCEDAGALMYRSLVAYVYCGLEPPAIRITYFYLAHAFPVRVVFDREEFEDGWQRILWVAKRIRQGMRDIIAGAPVLVAFPAQQDVSASSAPLSRHCERCDAA